MAEPSSSSSTLNVDGVFGGEEKEGQRNEEEAILDFSANPMHGDMRLSLDQATPHFTLDFDMELEEEDDKPAGDGEPRSSTEGQREFAVGVAHEIEASTPTSKSSARSSVRTRNRKWRMSQIPASLENSAQPNRRMSAKISRLASAFGEEPPRRLDAEAAGEDNVRVDPDNRDELAFSLRTGTGKVDAVASAIFGKASPAPPAEARAGSEEEEEQERPSIFEVDAVFGGAQGSDGETEEDDTPKLSVNPLQTSTVVRFDESSSVEMVEIGTSGEINDAVLALFAVLDIDGDVSCICDHPRNSLSLWTPATFILSV